MSTLFPQIKSIDSQTDRASRHNRTWCTPLYKCLHGGYEVRDAYRLPRAPFKALRSHGFSFKRSLSQHSLNLQDQSQIISQLDSHFPKKNYCTSTKTQLKNITAPAISAEFQQTHSSTALTTTETADPHTSLNQQQESHVPSV